ncbi:MAG: universal stress protein, partial [Steroidobacteraceae bacterium]
HRDAQAQYRHVALAMDLSNASLPMLQAAGRLGVLDDAYATVLHATSPPYEGMLRAVGVDEHGIEHYNEGWQDEARSRVQAMLGAAGIEAERARILVRTEPAAVAIRSVLEQERPELLAIGASRWLLVKRLLLGSVTDSMFRTSMCDVLVIPHQLDASKLRRSYAQAEFLPDRAVSPQLRLTETAATTGNRARSLSS